MGFWDVLSNGEVVNKDGTKTGMRVNSGLETFRRESEREIENNQGWVKDKNIYDRNNNRIGEIDRDYRNE